MLLVTLAALLTQSIVAVSGRTVFALFYAAILISAWYGGLGPGLLAAILATLAGNYFFLSPAQIQMPDLAGGVQVGTFLLLALFTGSLASVHRRTQQALGKSEERLTSSLLEREKLLKEKDVLMKEVYHRVRNNLQGISNLIYLQATYLKDERVRGMFRQTQDRLKSIALIHEKLYQTEDLVQLDLAQYIRSLAEYLIHSYRTRPELIKLDVKVDDMRLNVDTAIPVGIIVNELVSNSLKHAFPSDEQPGEIQIELRQLTPGEATLRVKDNGPGLPAEVDITTTTSLGLQLVSMLAGYMQGRVEIVRNNGTLFEVRLRVLDP